MGSLSRMLSEIHQRVESEVNPFVSLTTHSSSVQVKDDISPPETITIREIFKAPCLQSLRNLESLISTFSRESHEEINEYLCSLSDESMKKMTRSHQALEKTNFTQKSDSSLRALSTASDLMQKLSLRQKSAIFCQQIHDNSAGMDKSQVATSEDEQVHTPVNFADTNLKENIGKSEIPLQTEIWKGKLEVNVPDPVPITAQSKLPQIDPLENLIEQLRTELVFLRSQVSYPLNNIPGIFLKIHFYGFLTKFYK